MTILQLLAAYLLIGVIYACSVELYMSDTISDDLKYQKKGRFYDTSVIVVFMLILIIAWPIPIILDIVGFIKFVLWRE